MESKGGSNGAGQKQRVKVAVRLRPQLEKGDKTWVQVTDNKTLHTLNHRNQKETLEYEFETVFAPETNQATVYNECVKPLLLKTLNGQNASVFAYGPTGAGKTHTILGTATDPGVIPRCIKGIFNTVRDEKSKPNGGDWTYKITFSYLEIYQEKVIDLLDPRPLDLPIREDQHRNIFVTGLTEKPIADIKEFNAYFGPASRNRTTAATKLNERSSRSHSILLLKVVRSQTVLPYKRLVGKLYIIDLAGSEDNRRTGNQGVRLKESGSINSSLLALGQVVDALNKSQTCVPYRSSKLTRLLQDSLGGSAHTCMIVNLAPEERHYFDTYTTLHFARKTKKVVNHIKINESVEKIVKPLKRPLEKSVSKKSELTPKKQKVDPGPFLSPMLRDQEKFRSELKQEMFSRLTELEGRILDQMRSTGAPRTPLHSRAAPDSTTPDDEPSSSDDKQIGSTLGRLENIMSQLQTFREEAEHSTTEPPSATGPSMRKSKSGSSLSTPIKRPEKMKKSVSGSNLSKAKVFADGSTLLSAVDSVSSSPMFQKTNVIKKRGFTSTAARKYIDSPSSSRPEHVKGKENGSMLNEELQQTHNERVLLILNTGSLKELQDLQTVGGKRAKLIHSWRELNGHFTVFDDLRHVHGLTSKYVDNFMRSNLVRL